MLLVAGCASSVTKDIMVEAEIDPKTNFTGYASYTWRGSAAIVFDDKGQWEPPQFDADAEVQFLIDRELRKRGMSEDSALPDMIVAYAAGIDMDSMDIKKDPGETRPLDAEQPKRLQKMIAIFERYAEEKGIVPVADDWSPWSAL